MAQRLLLTAVVVNSFCPYYVAALLLQHGELLHMIKVMSLKKIFLMIKPQNKNKIADKNWFK
jgi:hypothetical protein